MNKKIYTNDEVLEMLEESNAIERVYDNDALNDAFKAWNYMAKGQRSFTTKSILKTHEHLVKNINPEIAGKYRKCDVYIGGECRRYISDEILESQIKEWIKKIIVKREPDMSDEYLDEYTKRMHIEYEKIHPFEDGNGRTGRIFYNYHRMKLKLPIHIIHEGKEQMEYYQWFK